MAESSELKERARLTVITTQPSAMRGPGEATRELIEQGIPLDRLRRSFAQFLASMREIIDVQQGRVGDFVLDEIEFKAEIGADGEFKLLGSGVGVSASTGVSFTLRRQPSP